MLLQGEYLVNNITEFIKRVNNNNLRNLDNYILNKIM